MLNRMDEEFAFLYRKDGEKRDLRKKDKKNNFSPVSELPCKRRKREILFGNVLDMRYLCICKCNIRIRYQ